MNIWHLGFVYWLWLFVSLLFCQFIEMNNIETIKKLYVVMREKKPKQTLSDVPIEVFGSMEKKVIVKELKNHPCGDLFEYEEEGKQ